LNTPYDSRASLWEEEKGYLSEKGRKKKEEYYRAVDHIGHCIRKGRKRERSVSAVVSGGGKVG